MCQEQIELRKYSYLYITLKNGTFREDNKIQITARDNTE